MFEGRPNCPECNSIHVAPLFYGLPGQIDSGAWGEYAHRGDYIIFGNNLKWRCLCCGHGFGSILVEHDSFVIEPSPDIPLVIG